MKKLVFFIFALLNVSIAFGQGDSFVSSKRHKPTLQKSILKYEMELGLHSPVNWFHYNPYDRSSTAVDGDTWSFGDHYYIKLNGVVYQLDQQSLSNGDKGDITVASSGASLTIDNTAVTLAKIQNAAANSRLLGSGQLGSGSSYVELTLGTNLSISGTTLNASGGIGTLNTLTASTQTFATGTSGTDFGISSATSTHTFNLPTASGTNRGALSSTDWTTFNNKVSTTRTISTTSPLSGGGDLSGNLTLVIANAAADGSTKGAASFTTNDFNASSGNISLDYTNGQASGALTNGFLSSSDWTTFNSKVGGSGTSGRLAFWNGSGSISSSGSALYNSATDALTVAGLFLDNNTMSTTSGDLNLTATGDVYFLKSPIFAPGVLASGPTNTTFVSLDPITLQAEYTTGSVGTAGTYTPTLTNGLNVDSSTGNDSQYMQVGTVVHVSGSIYIDPTLITTHTTVGISIPIASNFTNGVQASGTASMWGGDGQGSGVILSDSTNDRVSISINVTHTTQKLYYYMFTYQIL